MKSFKDQDLRILSAKEADLEEIMELVSNAQSFMIQNGNPNQWGRTYPDEKIILDDIKNRRAYVVKLMDDEIMGYFAIFTYEKSYDEIQGSWRGEGHPYWCVHRFITRPKRGIGRYIIKTLKEEFAAIRIDTMDVNEPMRTLLEKNGFVYAGLVTIEGRGSRVAYEYLSPWFIEHYGIKSSPAEDAAQPS